jgi:hypothetical protein
MNKFVTCPLNNDINKDLEKINDIISRKNISSEKIRYEEKLLETFQAIKKKKTSENPNLNQLLSNVIITQSLSAPFEGDSSRINNTNISNEVITLPDYYNQLVN